MCGTACFWTEGVVDLRTLYLCLKLVADMEDLDFDAFLKLMRVNSLDSLDSLDQYDSRLNSTANLLGLDSGYAWDGNNSQLEVVPE